jgi:tetratricopeptide (TPR) repeat protein
MPRPSTPCRSFRLALALGLTGVLSFTGAAQAQAPRTKPKGSEPEARSSEPAAALEQAIAAAEARLREGERQAAESFYRTALLEGFLLLGTLEAAEGRWMEARTAFEHASNSAVETRRALQSLALVHLQLEETPQAIALLTPIVGRNPKDVAARRLLARALMSNGQTAEAVQELEEARATAPEDLELTFALASGYLRLKKPEEGERLFAEIVKARPMPQTHVLIGRTYRDFREYSRARAELQKAIAMDPKVRRAHYYLGTVGLMSEGSGQLEPSIAEFEAELRLNPEDTLTSLRLGIALMEARRPADALPHLELASRADGPDADAFHYLGRAQLALDRPAEAVASLRRALALVTGPPFDEVQRGSIHYNLALALRKEGAADDAAAHFTEAELASERIAESARERQQAYQANSLARETTAAAASPLDMLLAGLELTDTTPPERQELRERIIEALCRAHLNLGVLQAQANRFPRAAEHFERAAELDPDFPQVQYSLGVARFNAKQFDKAAPALARVFEKSPADEGLRRMLATAWLNAEAYDEAADLLRDDPRREADPSLQFAYGLALVRGGRTGEGQAVFSRLLARHGESPELRVVLGQAYAQEGDYDSAVRSLEAAIQAKPTVAEAHAALGVIYLKQGRLAEAEKALRAELSVSPEDFKSQTNLATVLDLSGRAEEALPLLRAALKARPQLPDARYLIGKILLSEGAAPEAVQHLEAAARLSPEDANVRYQLGQAYQKLGRTSDAQREFEAFQKLKDARRGKAS